MPRSVRPLQAACYRVGDIPVATAVRAGRWFFLNGQMASDMTSGIPPQVAGHAGRPLAPPSRFRREADFILNRAAALLASEGCGLRQVVRLDQYYPTAQAVNPYQRARKALFADAVAPSTSVLVEALLVDGCQIDVSLIAMLSEDGRTPQAAALADVPVPQHSGFIPSLVAGDFVFVAGQMPNNEAMDGLAAAAYRPPNARWNGTDIRLQTEFLVRDRLEPALHAGGSSLGDLVKAQVYLTCIDDLPEFLDVWAARVPEPCALTVVPTSGLALAESRIEINVLGLRSEGATAKQIIEHHDSRHLRVDETAAAAVRAGELLCLSGLFAAGAEGASQTVRAALPLRHLGLPARLQMRDILAAARAICEVAGTHLEATVRAQHFVEDLHAVPTLLDCWRTALPDTPIPFSAVRTLPLPIPAADVLLDLWAFCG